MNWVKWIHVALVKPGQSPSADGAAEGRSDRDVINERIPEGASKTEIPSGLTQNLRYLAQDYALVCVRLRYLSATRKTEQDPEAEQAPHRKRSEDGPWRQLRPDRVPAWRLRTL